MTFIRMNNDDNVNFKINDVIRMCYVNDCKVIVVNGVIIDITSDFVTVLYITPDFVDNNNKYLRYFNKKFPLPIVEVENDTYRVTPILFYIFKDYYKYVDIITTLDKDMMDLIRSIVTKLTEPIFVNRLPHWVKRFYEKEITKLAVFYDIMIHYIIRNEL